MQMQIQMTRFIQRRTLQPSQFNLGPGPRMHDLGQGKPMVDIQEDLYYDHDEVSV